MPLSHGFYHTFLKYKIHYGISVICFPTISWNMLLFDHLTNYFIIIPIYTKKKDNWFKNGKNGMSETDPYCTASLKEM